MNIIFCSREIGGDISIYLDRKTALKEDYDIGDRDGMFVPIGYVKVCPNIKTSSNQND